MRLEVIVDQVLVVDLVVLVALVKLKTFVNQVHFRKFDGALKLLRLDLEHKWPEWSRL